MEDYVLSARIDERTTLYVSPLHRRTYDEHISADSLGGGDGYFVTRTVRGGGTERFDILAKASSFEAATDLFDMIVNAGARRIIA